MSYADDGKCHNAQPGTFNHECGRPAQWLGTTVSGYSSGFCTECKRWGYEAKEYVTWAPLDVRLTGAR